MVNIENINKLKEELILMFIWYRNTYLSKFKKISYNDISKSNKYNREDKMMLKHMVDIFYYINGDDMKYSSNRFFLLNLLSIPNRIEYRIGAFLKNHLFFVGVSDIDYDKLICMINKRHFKVI